MPQSGSVGALFQRLVVGLLAVTGITEGRDLAPDVPQPVFSGFLFDAVSYLAGFLLCIPDVSGAVVLGFVPPFNLFKQGPDPLLYVIVSRCRELLGITAPFYTPACRPRTYRGAVYVQVLAQLNLSTLYQYHHKTREDNLDVRHAPRLETADCRVVGELV